MTVAGDVKYAIRLLLKRPGFTFLTTLVMAAGIGLSVYLFSFMHTMVFKPLPFKDGHSLYQLSSSQNGVRNNGAINLHDYYEIRNNLEGMSEFSAFRNISVNVAGRDGVRRHSAVAAESSIFQLTRTQPALGREFTPAESQDGAEYVVVLGYDIWQNQFAGDAQIIDQNLYINGVSHRVIGVMPEGYFFPYNAELWTPLREDAGRLARGDSGNVYGLAHLEDGVSLSEINRRLAVIMQRIEQRYPETNNGISAYADTLQMTNVGEGIAVVYSMHIAAILILLLASINVGNLLLARAVERGKETAVRVALGAPRWRLISQMLWESIIICSVGGIIGLLILAWGLEVTETVTAGFFIDRPSFWWKFGIDAYTMQLFFLFLLGTVFLTGLLPAWRNSGTDFNTVLRDGTRGALGKKAGRFNRVLVISEIFLSIAVLIVAAVIMVGTYKATHADYGADTENILTARVLLTESDYDSPEKKIQFTQTLQSRLENSLGIGDVVIASALPGEFSVRATVALEGKEYSGEGEGSYPRVNYVAITPGSLAKLGVELKAGRYFSSVDDGLEKRSVIITDSFAARQFPNESAIGKRIRMVTTGDDRLDWLTVVGVVEHTVQGRVNESSGITPSVFRPFSQNPRNQMTIAMQMRSDRSAVTRTLRDTLESIDPQLPAFRINTYEENISRNTAPMRFISTVFLLFGIAAVALAASGIYGVMSNTINQRTHEIGVKRAIGAIEERITGEFLLTGLKQLLWGGIPGLLVGCAMGFAMSKIMGVGGADLVVIALSLILIIGSVVMLATYLPTRRALQIGPSEALRYE